MPSPRDWSNDVGTDTSPPAPKTIDAERTLQERIAEENAKYQSGFPVAGHGEPTRTNDPGRSR